MATRKLTSEEYGLARWLLEHGNEQAKDYLEQLDKAEATLWKCECGCASFNFKVQNLPEAEPGVNILSDYVFGEGESHAGVFIYSSGEILSGLEVYGLGDDAPSELPSPSEIMPFQGADDA